MKRTIRPPLLAVKPVSATLEVMRPDFLFLGTGPAEAIPRHGHRDPICLDAMRSGSKSRRLRSSGIYRSGRVAILLDAGPDVIHQLSGERIERLDAVLLTHAHLDAAGGLTALNHWAHKRGQVITVYTERATARRYGNFSNLPYRFVKSGSVENISGVSVRFFRVRHSVAPGFPTLGFRIGKFAYASDVASVPSASLKMLHGVKDLALDAAFWFETNFRGHMRVDEAIRIGRWLGVPRLYLTQTGHTYPPHDEAESAIKAYGLAFAPELEVTLAHDGLYLRLE